MAKKKVTKSIFVSEGKDGLLVLQDGTSRTAGQIIGRGTESSVFEQIIVQVLLEHKIKEIENHLKPIKERISLTKKDEIFKSLIEKGLMVEGEDPTIIIKRSNGKVLNVTVSSKIESGFEVEPSLEDLVESLPEEMTRTPKKTIETKSVLEKLYDAGRIPALYDSYFSKHPTEVTKVSAKEVKASE